MNAEEARMQADNAYANFFQNELEPYVNKLMPSILERIELRTIDKKYNVNIAIHLKRLYDNSPSNTRYKRIKEDALLLLFAQLEGKGYQVRVRTEAMVLSKILWKYEVKSQLIRISW
ncbi:hypothetical protein [Listeria monocytogenes]|uniref:hypothetical protein n=1 Tax=Listeria monocytogenes TaxID=1639 RepID=UPI001E5C1DFB|nr:hypothetical protein [Listeria monocytogenes]MCD2228809.1 hypothetical protein [Listeria monocytogenes]